MVSIKKEIRAYKSPSSRRAWIEIVVQIEVEFIVQVALLAEGVDRNIAGEEGPELIVGSPSSRRAWIEMSRSHRRRSRSPSVALLAEGVDRNLFLLTHGSQGRRSPSSRRAWIEMY